MPKSYSYRRAATSLLRAVAAIVSSTIIFLTFFRPFALPLWFARLFVTEGGFLLAPLALLPLFRPLRRVFGWSAWLPGIAAVVAQVPVLQAVQISRTLPARLDAAFGKSELAETMPFSLGALRLDLSTSAPYQRMVYATRGETALHFDFYKPNTAHPAPLVFVIHGGSWQGGDSTQLANLNPFLAARGYAVASVSYRFAPQHQFPAAQDDARDALNYVLQHASELGVDANRVVLLGRSAGAQMALLAAYTLRDPAIRGVVSFYGPTDLPWGYDHPANPAVIDTHGVLEAYLGGSPAQVPATYTAASPIAFVDATSPPTLMIHGGKDEMVFLENSERLAARLAQFNRPRLLVELPWAAHGFDANFAGPSGQISTYAVERFLASVIKNKE